MTMKKYMNSFVAALLFAAAPSSLKAEVGDTLWFDFTDRHVVSRVIPLEGSTKLEFRIGSLRIHKPEGGYKTYTYDKETDGAYTFNKPQRLIVRPNTYSNNDYTKETSQFCFQRSIESEHFIIFWENGLTKTTTGNISYDGYTCNVNTLIKEAEKIWKVNVDELGFVEPGKSTTDQVKIQM